CLDAIERQDYSGILEILVVDGGSTDSTRELARARDKVRILDNPRRIRPAGLNVGLAAARGEVLVRVDARTILAPDYVSRAVADLQSTGAAVVGGPMRFAAGSPRERGI